MQGIRHSNSYNYFLGDAVIDAVDSPARVFAAADSAFDLAKMEDRLRLILRLVLSPEGGFHGQLWSFLAAGTALFGASRASFFQRSLGKCIRYTHLASGAMEQLQIEETDFSAEHQALMCLKGPQLVCFSGKGCDKEPLLAYNFAGPGHCLIMPLANASAVLVFAVEGIQEGSAERLSDDDSESLALLAEGVARMVQLHASPDKILRTQEGFAVSGIRSLPEYIEIARLPAVFGIPGKVMDVLQRRIGQGSLAIDQIADELSISKRTLQRRLQQADINFAMLRDQVRFHYAIGYLVDQAISIDQISVALDFSDRTSFTNAFKRWTGLSPSTFRKLFRDYA